MSIVNTPDERLRRMRFQPGRSESLRPFASRLASLPWPSRCHPSAPPCPWTKLTAGAETYFSLHPAMARSTAFAPPASGTESRPAVSFARAPAVSRHDVGGGAQERERGRASDRCREWTGCDIEKEFASVAATGLLFLCPPTSPDRPMSCPSCPATRFGRREEPGLSFAAAAAATAAARGQRHWATRWAHWMLVRRELVARRKHVLGEVVGRREEGPGTRRTLSKPAVGVSTQRLQNIETLVLALPASVVEPRATQRRHIIIHHVPGRGELGLLVGG